jgi:hypothetical protein
LRASSRFHAGRVQAPEPGARDLQRVNAVDEESHPDSSPAAGDHVCDDLLAKRVLAENEGADIEPLLRATHDLEQCAARLGAVLMHAHDRWRGARQAEAFDQLLGPIFGVRADSRPG